MHGQNIYSYAFIAVLFPLYHACDHDVLYNSMEQAEQPDLKGHCLTGLEQGPLIQCLRSIPTEAGHLLKRTHR